MTTLTPVQLKLQQKFIQNNLEVNYFDSLPPPNDSKNNEGVNTSTSQKKEKRIKRYSSGNQGKVWIDQKSGLLGE